MNMRSVRHLRVPVKNKKRVFQSFLCVGVGVLLYLAAEFVDVTGSSVENGRLLRNPCGQGDAVYEVYVEEMDAAITITVPEQQMTEEEFREKVPEIVEMLCERILGENRSLGEVRTDLNLVKELEEYSVSVEWESEIPEVISSMGIVDVDADLEADEAVEAETGRLVYLQAVLGHGDWTEMVEIPVTVYPPLVTMEDRFRLVLEDLVVREPEHVEVMLPPEFEGQLLTYGAPETSQNLALIFLGAVAAGCLLLKERSDLETEKKLREGRLMEDYPDLVSEFMILTGAGYSIKGAWRKMAMDYGKSKNIGIHPLYEEMQVTLNQMETGMPEMRAYAEFGKRCQLRCYVKFASLLESGVSTGGKHMRKLLESEVEEAFKLRTDLAKRKGEELSSKLLLPMFGMLSVVMVIVVAPAFLSFC